jgi:hypothetical protein
LCFLKNIFKIVSIPIKKAIYYYNGIFIILLYFNESFF